MRKFDIKLKRKKELNKDKTVLPRLYSNKRKRSFLKVNRRIRITFDSKEARLEQDWRDGNTSV